MNDDIKQERANIRQYRKELAKVKEDMVDLNLEIFEEGRNPDRINKMMDLVDNMLSLEHEIEESLSEIDCIKHHIWLCEKGK